VSELEVVRLKETYLDIPSGMTGTIVHIYPTGAVEVEFVVGDTTKVVTLKTNIIERSK
jgi:hypothetical protein